MCASCYVSKDEFDLLIVGCDLSNAALREPFDSVLFNELAAVSQFLSMLSLFC